MKRTRALLIGLAAALATTATAVAATTIAAAPNDPGYNWAQAPIASLVAHHGWPASDTANLGRISTRRELARGLAELMTSRGQTPPAGLVRPADIAATDPDVTAISWVSTLRLLGTPGATFSPDATVTASAAELAIAHIFGLNAELSALAGLHMDNGVRVAVPAGFAQEVLGSELGLRYDYSQTYDYLETADNDPMPVASLAGIITNAIAEPAWRIASMASFATISLPVMTTNQITAVQAALGQVGKPYVWGGTSPNVQNLWGAPTAGGFDCSGLAWWSYKYDANSAALGLGNDLIGRTADAMAWENPSQKVPVSNLQAGDLVFFGPNGPTSAKGTISHVAISLGNGWIVQSTGSRGGVSVSQLSTYWPAATAFGRRPAAMGSPTTVAVTHPVRPGTYMVLVGTSRNRTWAVHLLSHLRHFAPGAQLLTRRVAGRQMYLVVALRANDSAGARVGQANLLTWGVRSHIIRALRTDAAPRPAALQTVSIFVKAPPSTPGTLLPGTTTVATAAAPPPA